ncbi:MAG TPA: NAD(P)H-binding protein [Rubrivivax sp.]|nr:NAD(P)H-binding protein [Rubrivivax sp.]
MSARTRGGVLLAGATGLVGRELTALLLAQNPPPALHALVRRTPAPADARVHWLQVDFARLPALPAAGVAWCCLGTTIKQAGSQAAFRTVDFDAVLAFAQAARDAGATHFGVVSALGASRRSANFYNRVKGEMEAAVAALGFDGVLIARPSLLTGDRSALGQPPRPLETLAQRFSAPLAALLPRSVRPIAARTVARGMLEAMRQRRGGVRIVESGELQRLGASE